MAATRFRTPLCDMPGIDDDAARATPGMSSVASFKLGETFSRAQVKAILQVLPAHEIVTRMIASARDILQRELPARIRFN